MNWLQQILGSRAPAIPGGPIATAPGGSMANGWPTMLEGPSSGVLPPPSGAGALPSPGSRALVPYGSNSLTAQGHSGGSQGLIRSMLSKIPGLLMNPYTAGAAALGAGAAGTGAALSSVNNGLAKDNLMMDPEMGVMPLAPAPQPAPQIPNLGTPAYGSTPMPTAQSMPMPQAAPGIPGLPGVPMPRPRPASAPVVNQPALNQALSYYNGPGSSSFGAGDPSGAFAPQQNFNVPGGGILSGLFGR